MSPLEVFEKYLDQFDYYFDVKIPDLSAIQGVKEVIVCCMGGSAFPIEIVTDHLKEAYRRDVITICRDYNLPKRIDADTLILVVSFSGSTEETVSCFNEAIEQNIPVIGISIGGEVSRICSEKNIPFIKLPPVLVQRFGTGYMISAVMRTLVEIKLIPRQDEEIRNIKVILEPVRINMQKHAEALAKRMKDRIFTVYTDNTHKSAGNIARIALNETAKVVGYNNIFSESNHNELACFDKSPYSHIFLLLTYPEINTKLIKRFELLKEILKEKDIVYEKINCNFSNILYREIYFTLFFTYLSYFLALEMEHDPVGTPTQDLIKKMLKQIDKN
ncbi:MAG: SIS domain-containing protein [bacterium]